MAKSKHVVSMSANQFHGEPDVFQLLICYSDGREIERSISRENLKILARSLTDAADQ